MMHAIVIQKGRARRFPYVKANLCLQGTWLKTDMDLIALPSWSNTANAVALSVFFFLLFDPYPHRYFSLSHFFKPTLAEATVWAVNPLPERQLNSIIRRANNLTELIVHYIPSQMAGGERIMFGISCHKDIRNRAHAEYDQELFLMNTTTLPQSESVEHQTMNTPEEIFFFSKQSVLFSFIIMLLQKQHWTFSSH